MSQKKKGSLSQNSTSGSEYPTPIQVDPEVFKALALKGVKAEDLESTINDIVFLYAKGNFINRSDVVGSFVTNNIYEENVVEGQELFDEMTAEFKGVAILGPRKGESLWIPDEKLHEALKNNQVILVMKSPRRRGIRSKDVDKVIIAPKDKTEFN